MKKSATMIAGLIVILAAISSIAQGPPTPAPELKKLDYFSGNWAIEATITQGPWGSGGKFTAMKGNFFLVGHGISRCLQNAVLGRQRHQEIDV